MLMHDGVWQKSAAASYEIRGKTLGVVGYGNIGAQLGVRVGTRLHGEQLRILLALMVLMVCAKLVYDLTIPPVDIYAIGGVK